MYSIVEMTFKGYESETPQKLFYLKRTYIWGFISLLISLESLLFKDLFLFIFVYMLWCM